MAEAARDRCACPVAYPCASRASGGDPRRAKTALRRRANGRLVQGDWHPFARLAATGGVRMIDYRNASLTDAEAIDRIYRTGFNDTFAHLYRPEDLRTFLSDFTLERWREELSDPSYAFRLAEEGAAPFGYIKLGPI